MTERLHRRVAGHHDIRLDGLTDLLLRAPGASVLDIGCNRGLVGFEFFANGAKKVHGVDIDAPCIDVARGVFIDLRNCESRFEVDDLTKPGALGWTDDRYDMIVMLATYHKLKRVMKASDLTVLVGNLGAKTGRYFAWRGTSNDAAANEDEMKALDRDLGLKRVHTSYLSRELGVAAIWERA